MSFLSRSSKAKSRLPDDIFVELVSQIHTSCGAIALLAFAYMIVGSAIFLRTGDHWSGGLAVMGTLVCIGRVVAGFSFRTAVRKEPLTKVSAVAWERRYALGGALCSLAMASLSARTILLGDAISVMLILSLTFGYLTGMIVHVSVRPILARIQLLLAVMPTAIVGMFFGDAYYALMGLLLIMYIGAAERMISYLHETISERLLSRNELIHLARHDSLTGLANRGYLSEFLDQAIEKLDNSSESLAVLCLDLDRFKQVNDTLGHRVGDALLTAVAKRLVVCTGPDDFVARIGGDEFVVIRQGVDLRRNARDLSECILGELAKSFEIARQFVEIGASIGVAFAPYDGKISDTLLDHADRALYQAKRQGRGMMVFHEAKTHVTPTKAA